MEEKDFQRIEQIMEQRDRKLREKISNDMEQKFGTLREEIGNVDRKVGTLGEEIGNVDRKVESLRREINEDFKHHLGIFTEDIHKKLQLVAEGHQMLSEKLDRAEERLEKKLDGVAADLTAHRADTEGHSKGYMVKEPED